MSPRTRLHRPWLSRSLARAARLLIGAVGYATVVIWLPIGLAVLDRASYLNGGGWQQFLNSPSASTIVIIATWPGWMIWLWLIHHLLRDLPTRLRQLRRHRLHLPVPLHTAVTSLTGSLTLLVASAWHGNTGHPTPPTPTPTPSPIHPGTTTIDLAGHTRSVDPRPTAPHSRILGGTTRTGTQSAQTRGTPTDMVSPLLLAGTPGTPSSHIVLTADVTTSIDDTTTVYEVHSGDWLGAISQRYLGNYASYPELAHLNGLTDPDLIHPGQRLQLPATATDHGPRTHAHGTLISPQPPVATPPAPTSSNTTPDGATPLPPDAPGAQISPPNADISAGPSTATPPTNVALSPRSTHRQPVTVATTHRTTGADIFDATLRIGMPFFAAALLATVALTNRRRHEHRRPTGRRPQESANPLTETRLRVVAEPAAVDRLDHALRSLAATLAGRPTDHLPDIVGAWLADTTVNLLLTEPCADPPHPWTADQTTWTLPGDAVLPDVDGQLAPLPALAAIGSQPGMHLLLDLERLGLVTITGDPIGRSNLLRYLAAELALNTWSDHTDIHIAGFDPVETRELLALNTERITAAPTIPSAITRIRRRAGQVVQSLDHLDADDPLAGRIADIAADAWMPQILLINHPTAEDITALEALDHDLAAIGRCAVAVIVASDTPTGRWPIIIDADSTLTIECLGMDSHDGLTAAQLPRTELTSLSELLTTARAAVQTPDGINGHDQSDSNDTARIAQPSQSEQSPHRTSTVGDLLPSSDHGFDAYDHDEPTDPTDDEAPTPHDQSAENELNNRPEQTDAIDSLNAPGADEAEDPQRSTARPTLVDPARTPPVAALVGPQPTRKRPTSPVRAYRLHDSTLDTDLRAWVDADGTRPRIAILGPVTVEAPGHLPEERVRFYAELITFLAARGSRGVTTDQFDDAIWPEQQVKANTRRVAVARARRWLGETPDGQPWLPDATTDRRYHLRDGYLLDWTLFKRLRARGESRGPAGTGDLRNALALVRGVPLAGADIAYSSVARNPFVWLPTSDIQPHHLAAAIADTAHRLVELSLASADIPTARWAIDQARLGDPERTNDIAWRDHLRVAAAEGNHAELDQLLDQLMTARDAEIPEDLDTETYRLLCELIPNRLRISA